MSNLEALARRIFDSQPFSRRLGATLESVGDGAAEIALTVADELTQQRGYAHGGVISYLADNSMAFAGGLALGGDVLMSEFKINFVRPALGEKLIAPRPHNSNKQASGRMPEPCICGFRRR